MAFSNSDSSPNSRRLIILYGSQTGTAEDVALQISQGARRLHIATHVSSMDDFDYPSMNPTETIVFVCSTAGHGSQPANMTSFWTTLRQANLPGNFLDGIKFTVFGLGDSSYPRFNWAAKKLYRRLQQLGAEPFYEVGVGDDQHPRGLDGTLIDWLDGLYKSLLQIMPLAEGLEPIPAEALLPSNYLITNCEDQKITPPHKDSNVMSDSLKGTLTVNKRLTPTAHWQDTRHLEFSFDHDVQFDPGAVAEFIPQNSEKDVEKIIKLMDWADQADQVLEVRIKSSGDAKKSDIPVFKDSLRTILRTRVDINKMICLNTSIGREEQS